MTERGYYSKKDEPEKFYEQCAIHYKAHRERIERTRTILLEQGVPEEYIFVCQTNRGVGPQFGDLYPLKDTKRVEQELNCIRDSTSPKMTVGIEDSFVFTSIDIRDRAILRAILSKSYFPDAILDMYLADIEGRQLIYDRAVDEKAFHRQAEHNKIRTSNLLSIRHKELIKESVQEDAIVVVRLLRGDTTEKKGTIFLYSEKAQWNALLDETIKNGELCYYPDLYSYTCANLCDHVEMGRLVSNQCRSDFMVLQNNRKIADISVMEHEIMHNLSTL